MDWDSFARWGNRIVDMARDYRTSLRDKPVRAQTAPGAVYNALPATPPDAPEPMEQILEDFQRDVMPGLTHWQHPRFFAYFPANAAPPSVLAEMLVSALAPQCMLWQTSPAATEMETRMMDWLRQAIGLPDGWHGTIQDSASSATLAAVLTMRERTLNWTGNSAGLPGQAPLRVYSSAEVHSSIDRAIRIAGLGQDNLVRIAIKGAWRGMDPDALDAAITADKAAGLQPAGVILCVGATSVGATDPVADCIAVARKHDLYVHVDAAWAGAAMICPEFRHFWTGVDGADSVVFNPHKWLGANFDCAAHFLRDPEPLVKTLAIQPAFLKTHGVSGIVDYSEWSVPLGRRFRALKLWFLIRAYGLDGLREVIRNHVTWAEELHNAMEADRDFEIITRPMWSLFSFRYAPDGAEDRDALNLRLIEAVNADGRVYLTQTNFEGQFVIRFQAGSFETTREDVMMTLDVVREVAGRL
ncbi:MAG: aspartate aminotransferase family protein [Rhodobacteraceae bacterium]|nr:aspartate aminotransferase family protein [Paracoccaceae bacterium]